MSSKQSGEFKPGWVDAFAKTKLGKPKAKRADKRKTGGRDGRVWRTPDADEGKPPRRDDP